MGPRAGRDGCGKTRPSGIRSPDRPARSESLHRLIYPGPVEQDVVYLKRYVGDYCQLGRCCGYKIVLIMWYIDI
jgi:hypothetical protein